MTEVVVGAQIGGYTLLNELGHGAMATVWRAHHKALNRNVALKTMAPHLLSDAGARRRFIEEARAAASLDHPNIIPIYEVGGDEEPYISMRLVQGKTLSELLEEANPLPFDRILRILSQLAAALDFAHEHGVVHRDVKPGNVLIEAGDRVTLSDFGIARGRDRTRLTQLGSIIGTPSYLAPEIVQGSDATAASDRYALGVLAYEMVAGRLPFEGATDAAVLHAHAYEKPPSLRTTRPDISRSCDQAVSRMLSKDPSERWPSATAFVAALGARPLPNPQTVHESTWSVWGKPVGAVVVAVGVVAAVILTGGPMPPDPRPMPTPTPTPSTQASIEPTSRPEPTIRPAPIVNSTAAPTTSGFWSVCVWCDFGSFDPKSEADKAAAQLRADGFPSEVLASDEYASLNPGYWITISGHFSSVEQASAHQTALARRSWRSELRWVGIVPAAVPGPEIGTRASRWAAIVASTQTQDQAEATARRLQAFASNAAVAFSTNCQGLNPGFWIAYSGPFASQDGAASEARRLQAAGFAGAYPREFIC